MEKDNSILGMHATSKYLSISRQAIYVAMKNRKIRAEKIHRRWAFKVEDLDFYIKNKWNRSFSVFNNAPLYDKSKGEYSIKECAKIIDCHAQHLYHACRKKILKTEKKNSSYIIQINDLIEYAKIMKRPKPRSK